MSAALLDLEQRTRAAHTLRFLAADAIQKANSGHPGAPMGQADLAMALWDAHLRFDPQDPQWIGRDRFVLSCGHASMLLYGLLHLWGFDVSIDDLAQFRQWDSRTPGHPEVGHTPGVELTTGPLGQGVATSVGMALANRMLSARFADDQFDPVGARVFALCSDGDLMEGISAEAASLAGHWKLDNLIWLYDDNKITIDGHTALAFTEDIPRRFEACGWRILHADGHDFASLNAALAAAVRSDGRPTLVVCRTQIGWGSPNKIDTSGVHGSPLGEAELAATRQALNWPADRLSVPEDVAQSLAGRIEAKRAERAAWDTAFEAWRARDSARAQTLTRMLDQAVPADLLEKLLAATPAAGATRKLGGAALEAALKILPWLAGGSADLFGSNGFPMKNDLVVGHPDQSLPEQAFGYEGRKLHFGIREHAMGAITNGFLLHGGLRAFSGTFLVFSDYVRPAVRLAALSQLPNLFVFTHDSIFLGEDGPTHQPVEHHWALRDMPGLVYWRPADGVEAAQAVAWSLAQRTQPCAFALSRQDLPALPRAEGQAAQGLAAGAWVVQAPEGARATLVGTGSEVHLCLEAAQLLAAQGLPVRVVSMPAVELFVAADEATQAAILPEELPICTVEAGITLPWRAISGRKGLNVGIDRFGASAPAQVLAEQFGFTPAQLAARVSSWLA